MGGWRRELRRRKPRMSFEFLDIGLRDACGMK